MNVVLDETVLRMAELDGRPVQSTARGVEWGWPDVLQEVTVEEGRFVLTTTERDKPRIDFTTDDAGALDRFLLVLFGTNVRRRRGLAVPLTAHYPPVPDEFEVRGNPVGDVEITWTAEDGRAVTAGGFSFGAERRFANVCRVPLPVLEEALLDDGGRPQPLF